MKELESMYAHFGLDILFSSLQMTKWGEAENVTPKVWIIRTNYYGQSSTTTLSDDSVSNPDLVIEHPVSRCAVVDVQQLSESNQ